MMQMKQLARCVALACGGLASVAVPGAALAQQSGTQAQNLERVTVTGSNIRRVDTETVSPVDIITREDIERSGKPNVAELLRSLPANTGGSFGESFSNSFAPGAAGISLRGLGQKTTLVLLNGRRVTGYGFAQNIQDTFVDLNAIPTTAVERVEILKDGASAIYGSDAIAGVVNVILRREFKGVELSASAGSSEGKEEYRASIGAGFGDLATQKFNLFGVIDYYTRDELLMSDTKFGKDRDYRGEAGGRNFQSITAGGVWTGVPGAANANARRAISECANYGGRVINYQEAVLSGFIAGNTTDNPANANSLQSLLAVPLGTGFNLPGNTWCLFDQASQISAIPKTERIGFLGRGTFDFGAGAQGYAELSLSRVETEQAFTPPFYQSVALTQTSAGLRTFPFNITYAPGVAGNPLGTNARFTGNLSALGLRDATITSDTVRGLVGLRYSLLGWDFDSAAGYSKNEVDADFRRRVSLSQIGALFGVPTGVQPPVPVSNGSACNLDQPSTTLAACSSILVDVTRKSTSELTFVDTKATTEIGTLPGGPIGVAVGAEFRDESLKDRPDPRAVAGDIIAQGITNTDGSRTNLAAFAELALPLTRQLEAQVALRGDHYSDFGNAVTPKVGLKFKPNNQWLLRANWGRGFRAPTLPEISPSTATSFVQVNDPVTNGSGINISRVRTSNPDLEAEKSRTSTLGFVWEPSRSFSIGVDYFDISWSNIVTVDNPQVLVNNDALTRDPVTCTGGDPAVVRDATNNCAIVYVFTPYKNVNRTNVRGADIDLRHALTTGLGLFTTRLNATYIDTFDEDGFEAAGRNDGNNTIPRWKALLSLDWERGGAVISGRLNYTHGYYQGLLTAGFFGQSSANPAFQTGAYPVKVRSHTTFDLFGRYAVTPKLTLSASVVNLFDELPPYDPGFSTTLFYDFSLFDLRGRQYRVGVNYKF